MEEECNNQILDLLEGRVRKLEDKITGNDEISQSQDAISVLSTLGSKLGNALSTRDRMMMVMKRIDELERYLDPHFSDSPALTDEVKMDLVLAQEEKLQMQYQQLNKVATMKNCLTSQNMAEALSELFSDLSRIKEKNEQQAALAADQSFKISQILGNYNAVIATLAETFVQLENNVTKAELAATPKKTAE